MHIFSDFITSKEGRLHYKIIGKGSKTCINFHGFAQSSDVFLQFSSTLAEEYTFYSFDIFFHGKSNWKNSQDFLTKEDWQEFIDIFLAKHQIKSFSMIAFSIGAKLAINTIDIYKNKVEKIFFIAPDGIKKRWIYEFTTNTKIGNYLFFQFLNHFKIFEKLLKVFRKNKYSLFLRKSLNTVEKRERIYKTWTLLRKTPAQKISEVLEKDIEQIKFYWFFGKKDWIISYKIEKKIPKISNSIIQVFDCTHWQILEKTLDYIKKQELLKP